MNTTISLTRKWVPLCLIGLSAFTGILRAAPATSDLTTWTPLPNSGTGTQRLFTLTLIPGQKCLIRLRVTQTVP